LGLGSNLGRRERMIFRALRRVQSQEIRVSACSGLYESEPAEGAGGGLFLNAVVEVRTLLCPGDLLNRLKTIEKSMGRTAGHNQPRVTGTQRLNRLIGDARHCSQEIDPIALAF